MYVLFTDIGTLLRTYSEFSVTLLQPHQSSLPTNLQHPLLLDSNKLFRYANTSKLKSTRFLPLSATPPYLLPNRISPIQLLPSLVLGVFPLSSLTTMYTEFRIFSTRKETYDWHWEIQLELKTNMRKQSKLQSLYLSGRYGYPGFNIRSKDAVLEI